MRIGFLSDAHGNVEAFQVGLAVLREVGAERINFLGDAVGYLPGSSVVEMIVKEKIPAIQGNHEAMMVDGGLPAEREELYRLNETWQEMTPSLRSTISAWPRRRTIETRRGDILLIHGSPSDETHGYVYPDTDLDSFSVPSGTAVFMGNTHRPFVRKSRGALFVNVGSCGLPRDVGKLGSACLYDTASGDAEIIRFDISDAVERALGRCGAIAQDVRDVFVRSPSNYVGRFMKRLDPDDIVTVLVTAIGGGGHGEQILKALRAAPRTNYRIVGADASADCTQFQMVDHALTLPKASDRTYIDAVLEVCRAFDVQAVFHGCEPELRAMSEARDRFADADIFLPVNPSRVIELCMNKRRTAEFLEENGFAPPRFTEISDVDSLAKIDWFPVVLKPVLGGGGSRDCFIAQNPRELEILTEYLGTANERFLVQEYVGNCTSEYTVGVLHDMDGQFLNSIALKRIMSSALNYRTVVRNLSARPELGEWLIISSGVSHGTVATFPEVTGPCERIARALGCRGAVNVQCRLVDGEVRVFEINPRFSGTTSIRAMLGYNEPDILIRRHLMGEDIEPRFAYSEGTVFRSLTESFVSESGVQSWDEIISGRPVVAHEHRE